MAAVLHAPFPDDTWFYTFTPGATPSFSSSSVPNPIPLQTIQNIETIVLAAIVVLYPALFFMWQGLCYPFARMFHGQGTFLVQCHISLLANVPVNLISTMSGLLIGLAAFSPTTMIFATPFFWLFSLAVSIYYYVLQIMAMMAAHRLNAMNAAGVVFLPLAVVMLLACILGVVLGVALVYFMMMQVR
jgi:hypothetical protein